MFGKLLLSIFALGYLSSVSGHGYTWEPVARSSAWRKGFDTPTNWDDDGLNCGGFGTQYDHNGGKCGECGDDYAASRPRENEAGGKYAAGVIVANYTKGQTLDIEVKLTTNHLGYFEFNLCVNNDPSSYVDQACLDKHPLQLADGSGNRRPIETHNNGIWTTTVVLPADVTCTQCVLQWHYSAGNSWGDCGDGSEGMGCGDQEWFRGCSDIGIY